MPNNTHRIRAWSISDSYGPDEIKRDGPAAADRLFFRPVNDNSYREHGFVPVGYADVVLHIDSHDQIIAAKVEALRAEATKTQADAEAKVTHINRQINELLAIPMQSPG